MNPLSLAQFPFDPSSAEAKELLGSIDGGAALMMGTSAYDRLT